MANASHERSGDSAPKPGLTTKLMVGEDHNASAIAIRQQILVRSGMHQALTSGRCTAFKSPIVVQSAGTDSAREGWVVKDPAGQAIAALVPSSLTRFRVHAVKGSGFVDLGIDIESVNGKLALYDREAGGQYHFLGKAPANLSTRFMSTAALSEFAELPDKQWQEMPFQNLGLVTWQVQDRKHARSGSFATGWRAVARTRKGDYPVFMKVLNNPDIVAKIVHSDSLLEEATRRNARVANFAPRSAAVSTAAARTVMGDAAQPGSTVILERLVQGPTLNDLAAQVETPGHGVIDFTHPRQFATCGELMAQGLADLNDGAPVGRRLLASDATKPDNLMASGFTRNAHGEVVPTGLVCPDRDHYQVEEKPAAANGTYFFSDVRGMTAIIGMRDFSLVDRVHSFQVGRSLLGIALGEMLPAQDEKVDTQDYQAMMNDQQRQFDEGIALFDRRYGTTPATAGGELGRLIRDCCAFEEVDRPALHEVINRAATIARLPH